jgi:plasmid stabilization system protein ParE
LTRVRITAQAARDIEKNAEYYEQRKEGLGLEFTDRVIEAIEAIERAPLGFSKVVGEGRRALLHRFPFALWFVVEDDAIVIACLHHKRDLKLARERIAGVIEIPRKPEP